MHPMLSVGSFGIFQCVILFFSCQFLRMEGRGAYLWLLFFAMFGLGSALPVAGAFLPDNRGKFLLQGFGNIFLGYALYYAAFLVLFKVLRSILFSYHKSVPGYLVFLISMALTLIVGTYGMFHAQQTKVTTLDIVLSGSGKEPDFVLRREAEEITNTALDPSRQSEGAFSEERPLKAGFIADLHLSVNTQYSTIEKMVHLLNEEKPDVVFFAGDMFTSSYQGLLNPDRYARLLRQIEAPLGVYGVYGNHDVEETLFGGFSCGPKHKALRSREMEEFFQKAGIQMLEDELITLKGTRIQVAGRLDGEKTGDGVNSRMPVQVLLGKADKGAPILVLEHEPKEYEELKECGADLVLSGHTHRGQIFPGNLLVPLFNQNGYGYKKIYGLDTVVTSGVGYYGPPMRIGTDSEVMILNISFGEGGMDA